MSSWGGTTSVPQTWVCVPPRPLSAGSSLTPGQESPATPVTQESLGSPAGCLPPATGAEGSHHLSPGFQTSGRSTANKATRAPGWPAAPLTRPRPCGSTPSRLAPLPAAGPVVLELGLDWRTASEATSRPSSGSCPPPPGSRGRLGPCPRCGCTPRQRFAGAHCGPCPVGESCRCRGTRKTPLELRSASGSTRPPSPLPGGTCLPGHDCRAGLSRPGCHGPCLGTEGCTPQALGQCPSAPWPATWGLVPASHPAPAPSQQTALTVTGLHVTFGSSLGWSLGLWHHLASVLSEDGGVLKMVVGWPIWPLPTPHICSSRSVAANTIKTISDF